MVIVTNSLRKAPVRRGFFGFGPIEVQLKDLNGFQNLRGIV